MNIALITYKTHLSKIDIDFVDISQNLEYENQLRFYTSERMFVAKLLTFQSRKGFKDIFDSYYLLQKIEPSSFEKPEKLAQLIDNVLDILNDKALITSYKKGFRSIDLRFQNLKEHQIESFIKKSQRELRVFRNQLLK